MVFMTSLNAAQKANGYWINHLSHDNLLNYITSVSSSDIMSGLCPVITTKQNQRAEHPFKMYQYIGLFA